MNDDIRSDVLELVENQIDAYVFKVYDLTKHQVKKLLSILKIKKLLKNNIIKIFNTIN